MTPWTWWGLVAGGFCAWGVGSCCLVPLMYLEAVIEEVARQDREDVKPPPPSTVVRFRKRG